VRQQLTPERLSLLDKTGLTRWAFHQLRSLPLLSPQP
jgi:hypothetical protein